VSDIEVDNSIQRGTAEGEKIQCFAYVVGVCICLLLCCCLALNVAGGGHGRQVELESRINPNDASVASMVRLAGIGPARATAIAAYRDSFGEKDGQGGAFRDCSDLQKVYGIGPKTAESMSEWLRFE